LKLKQWKSEKLHF